LNLTAEQQKDIAGEVMRLLGNREFAKIFGPQSMAEVPISGLLPDGRLISGQIDRIAILEDKVLIIDYKTNRPPPASSADIPEIYKIQMAAYADTLREIYPGRNIKVGLLWTYGPTLMEISV